MAIKLTMRFAETVGPAGVTATGRSLFGALAALEEEVSQVVNVDAWSFTDCLQIDWTECIGKLSGGSRTFVWRDSSCPADSFTIRAEDFTGSRPRGG